MEAKKLLEEKITKKLAEHPELSAKIGAAVAIELTGEGGGRWLIDFTKSPASYGPNAKAAAATTVSISTSDFVKISAGELNPQMAFFTGRIKVDGNLGLAVKLGELFS